LHYIDPVWGDREKKENKTFVRMIEGVDGLSHAAGVPLFFHGSKIWEIRRLLC